ncbi:hypothetical protein DFJ58DRAFT_730275 [Suillus subalutaceus]|uniref:uncharacterized protein n=1 Tax=Suillus subalutaceus TaxID=48586 RepID=UPI001B85EAF7|nr:uncharacterized protein DFJ58DRAFT_730275 [Suillus subalutaceus]KAG1847181.1 hypothetical protein DFJ58DRAFT_730275 [Suillus subalutaceus]
MSPFSSSPRTYIVLTFAPNENPDKCRMLIDIYSCFGAISLTCSECVFVLETYALWNNNRIVLVATLSALLAIIVSFICIWFTAVATSHVTTSTIPGTTGCYRNSRSVDFSMPFLLLFVFALDMRWPTLSSGLVSLTLIRVTQSYRTAKGSLQAVLAKHNIFYYTCTVNVLMPMQFSHVRAYNSVFEHLQVFILAILATRMHLHLWHSDRHVHGSDTLVYVSKSNMPPTDCTV